MQSRRGFRARRTAVMVVAAVVLAACSSGGNGNGNGNGSNLAGRRPWHSLGKALRRLPARLLRRSGGDWSPPSREAIGPGNALPGLPHQRVCPYVIEGLQKVGPDPQDRLR